MQWCVWLVVTGALVAAAEDSCLTGEESPYLWFGSKTAYTFAVNHPYRVSNSKVYEVPGCRAIAFWMVARHGSHLPEASEIKDLQNLENVKRNVIENYKNGNYRNTGHRMCASDLNNLERWQWNLRHNEAHAGELTSDGYLGAQGLAQAWKQRYPELLTSNRHDYMLKYVDERRVHDSMRAFTEGLFGQQDDVDVPKPSDDQLLRPNKFCPSWVRDVEQNNQTFAQVKIFESKAEYKEMISNISRRLGYNYDADVSVVKTMYQMCRYNKAWDVKQTSPWCAVFSKEDLRRLEYAEDLETYYKYGYGTPVNKQLGCGLLRDMMTFFSSHLVEGDLHQQPRSKIYLSSEETVLLTGAALGGFRDVTPLTGDNYHGALTQSRRWRTSYIAPYTANIAAVLYRCNNNLKSKYQVMFLSNELPLTLEECRVGLCDWDVVSRRHGAVADICDTVFCSLAPHTACVAVSALVLASLALLL